MALFDNTDKSLEILPDLKKDKKLSKILGTDPFLKKLRGLSGHELGNFRAGALGLAIVFGSAGYYFYHQYRKQKYQISLGYYKLINCNPIDAGNQFWYNARNGEEVKELTYYYRMPRKEFDVKYRMRSAFISGQFDHDKEILIPKKNNGEDGYDIITPFYYYRKLYTDKYLSLHADGTPYNGLVSVPAGIAVFRGWVPACLKDRRLRPLDFNSGKKEYLQGTIKLSTVNKHDFSIPNDPSNDLWINYSLEDFAHYWNLPNIRDAMHCYFREINFDNLGFEKKDVYPIRPNIEDAIVENGKEVGITLDRGYKRLMVASSSLSALCTYMLYLAA